MNVDERFQEAARSVRRATEPFEPPTRATSEHRQRQQRSRRVVCTTVVAVALLAIGLVCRIRLGVASADVMTAGRGSSGEPATEPSGPTVSSAPTVATVPTGEVSLVGRAEPAPSSFSAQLPVTASPASELHDHVRVTVSGHGFPKGAAVVGVLCTAEVFRVGPTGGVCDSSQNWQILRVDENGNVSGTIELTRHFTTTATATRPAQTVDCADATIDPVQYEAVRAAGAFVDWSQPGVRSCLVSLATLNPEAGRPEFYESGAYPIRFASDG
jgi:hypothetical protein